MLWLVSQSRSDSDSSREIDGWAKGARVEEKELEGEVAKCVAMNPKNGMKRRLNEKRAKARQ